MQARSTPEADIGHGDKQAKDAGGEDQLIIREATIDKSDDGSAGCFDDGSWNPG